MIILFSARLGKLYAIGRNNEGACSCSTSCLNIIQKWRPCQFNIASFIKDNNSNNMFKQSNSVYEITNKKERRKERRKMERMEGKKETKKSNKKTDREESIIVSTFDVDDFSCGNSHSLLLFNNRTILMASGVVESPLLKKTQSNVFTPLKGLALKTGQKKFTFIASYENSILITIDNRFIMFHTPTNAFEFDAFKQFGCSEIYEIALNDPNSFAFTSNTGRIYVFDVSTCSWQTGWNNSKEQLIFFDIYSAYCFKAKSISSGKVTNYYTSWFQNNISNFDKSSLEIFPSYLCFFAYDRKQNEIQSMGNNSMNQQGIGSDIIKQSSFQPHSQLNQLMAKEQLTLHKVLHGQFYSVLSFSNSLYKPKLDLPDYIFRALRSTLLSDIVLNTSMHDFQR
ncbi:hypothetical protein FDP41_000641 [Naegleria fowleri]|uniref:Uncharacterized protein n=1 Tax=Naegleria fowleri TaxID=5763 RepID=A0A6A5CCC8_NAEFO|nr:uncharacterized protein FDP41_000641 [Naegleria fowleri]KAF0984742.1 hypothetical protein FDP41_000641 [Naegleria fowleri]